MDRTGFEAGWRGIAWAFGFPYLLFAEDFAYIISTDLKYRLRKSRGEMLMAVFVRGSERVWGVRPGFSNLQ